MTLRSTLTAWLVVLLVTLGAGMAAACSEVSNAASLRAQLLAEVNAQRTRAGLAALTRDARLEQAAWVVACDNARRNRLNHTTADGSSMASRVRAAGYRWRALNENIAMQRGNPGQVVAMWMRSPPHRRNIEARGTRHFGAAVARSASGQLFWAMVSAQPR
jgi:uncharacterized protein YkwD